MGLLSYCNIIKNKILPPCRLSAKFHPGRFIAVGCLSFIMLACSPPESARNGYTIGIMNPNLGTEGINRGFIEGLGDLGYKSGVNTTFITATTENDFDSRLKDMIGKKVDLIFSVTTPATKKAVNAAKGKDIPVIFAVHDPVESGIMKSLSSIEKNITGIQIKGSIPKALDWLIALSPGMDTILVPLKFDTPATKQSLDDLQQAAQIKDIELVVREVGSEKDILEIFRNMPEEVDAVFLLHSIFISSHTDAIVREAGRHHIPVGGGISTYNKGALITFGVNHIEVGRQASRLARQVLQGTKTENIPVETAEFYLGINLETARSAKITVPNSVLSFADYIIPPIKEDSKKDVKLITQ